MTNTMSIEGMMCMHCEATVKKALEKLEGVTEAKVSHEAGTAVVVRRDDRSKEVVAIADLPVRVPQILEEMQAAMYERAKAFRDTHLYEATDYETFVDTINNKPGFVNAMWCGDAACEAKIKEDTTATSRCMPFEQKHLSDTCVCCGKPAKIMVTWGKAY